MAIMDIQFRSEALWRSVSMEVILPVDKWEGAHLAQPGRKYKTLYLLHGLHGSYQEWITKTRIRRWAEKNNLAVVMPAGDNMFYVDQPQYHANYGEFIGRELLEVTRAMFPLSDRREDTFLGGLSMGGYGTLRNGLKYNENFSRLIVLSAALQLFETQELTHRAFREALFGDLEAGAKTDINPRVLLEDLQGPVPEVFLACGTEDGLLPYSRLYRELLRQKGIPTHYEEWPGGHDWDFWDAAIEKAIRWLPL